MLFSNTDKDYSHCHGCGLCTLVCPAWQQTRDIACSPHGHAKALQAGGEINVKGLFDCVLCGACEAICPENIELMALLVELRNRAMTLTRPQLNNESVQPPLSISHATVKPYGALLLVDEDLSQQKVLVDQILGLLNNSGNVELAPDNGSDISLAINSGTNVASQRVERFLDSIKHASKLIVSDGLFKRVLQQWLPDTQILSLGHVLSSLPSIREKLGAKDLYIIESQAYHSDFDKMVMHYDELKRSRGCELNLDLQRLAIPTGGTVSVTEHAVSGFDTSKQGQWILQGLDVERIIVESVGDGAVMAKISDAPVMHVAELVTSKL